jgi:hypothetical protein
LITSLHNNIGPEELLSGSDKDLSDNGDSDGRDEIHYESDIPDDDITAEEMVEQLETCLGLGQDEELWKLRKSTHSV